MGSTYSVGKAAGVIVDPSTGGTYYALFEETFESNVSPRTPRWSAIHFGTERSCIEMIVKVSSACEGGMLKGSRGDILPENYIRQWRHALRDAGRLSRTTISVTVGEGLYQTSRECLPGIRSAAIALGVDLREEEGKLSFELGQGNSLALLERLTSQEEICRFSIWKVLDRGCIDYSSPAGLYLMPRPAIRQPDVRTKVLRVCAGGNQVEPTYLVNADGSWRMAGWAYSTVGSFVRQETLATELIRPGSAEGMITAFRNLVKHAAVAPDTTQVKLTADVSGVERWHVSKFEELCERVGLTGKAQAITSLGSIIKAGALHLLSYLPETMVSFQIEDERAESEELVPACLQTLSLPQKDAIDDFLSNDDNSSDEELSTHLMRECQLTQEQANACIAMRPRFFMDPMYQLFPSSHDRRRATSHVI